ncbi:MAG: motility protein A [Nitrospirae bacterium]|nr:motility protein A [Nitrospirota bacterium]
MSTIIGILIGLVLLFAAVFQQGGVAVFFNLHAVMITMGGTLAATFISFPLPRVMRAFVVMVNVFRSEVEQPMDYIRQIIDLSVKARKQSLLSLEDNVKMIKNRFLRVGVEMVVDGHSPETIRSVMETEIEFMEERHSSGANIFRSAGRFAPAFGLVGTLIGLIAMLRAVASGGNNAQTIGAGMSVALVATFYGALLANLFFYPVAEKLRSRTEDEMLLARVLLDGVLLLQKGVNPRVIEKKLNAHLPPQLRRQYYFGQLGKDFQTGSGAS